tara:strand:+ start:48 stop:365 length:318 start_codon:yes stop_codon:yes gene_type:complete
MIDEKYSSLINSLMNENKLLKEKLQQSEENFRRLDRLKSLENQEKTKKYIYESPDNGTTIYRREFGKEERVLMEGFISGHMVWKEVPRIPTDKNNSQLDLFDDGN